MRSLGLVLLNLKPGIKGGASIGVGETDFHIS